MVPFPPSKFKPSGSVPTYSHDVTAPPVLIGKSDTAELLVNVTSRDEYVKTGAMSFTVIEMVVEISPAELLAQTVNIVAECIPVGVPVIAPVISLNTIPVGNVPSLA